MTVHFEKPDDMTSDAPTPTLVPYSRLRPGHEYPGCDINMRKTYADADITPLVDSIRKKGILQSLLVRISPDLSPTLYVVAGGLRYAALARLVEEGTYAEDQPVPVIVRDDLSDADALDLSLTENDCRLPPHPVDRYEAFAKLKALGQSTIAIAIRFGLDARQVERYLALGDLAPTIRAAWREREISDDVAKAFTLARDASVQERLFEQLKMQQRLWPSVITQAIRGDDDETAPLLEFVGRDAYAAAGGAITEDLFGESHMVSNPGLLAAMANDKLDRVCVRLVGEGWSWAKPETAMPADWAHCEHTEPLLEPPPEETEALEKIEAQIESFEALEQEGNGLDDEQDAECERLHKARAVIQDAITERGFTEHQKKESGCVLRIVDGRLSISYGVIAPSVSAPACGGSVREADEGGAGTTPGEGEDSPKSKKDKKTDATEISTKTAHWLSHTLTDAAAEQLAATPDLALAVLLAGFASRGNANPVRVSHDGQGSHDLKLTEPAPFAELLERFAARAPLHNIALLALVAGAALDFRKDDPVHHSLTVPGVAALCAMIPRLDDCIRRKFDAKAYFDSAPKPVIFRAIVEALGEEKAVELHLATKGRAELAKFALAHVVPTGWLPPQLRTAQYHAPAPDKKADTPAAPAKKTRKKRAA